MDYQETHNDKVGYYHKRLDTGEVFYVGIGTPSRPYEDKHRNNHWNNIVEKVGYEVILVEKNLSWDEACEWEKMRIKEIGRRDLGLGPLVNMTDGGEGTQGVLITEERRTNISSTTKQAMSNPEVIQKMKDAKVDFTPWNSGMKGWNSGKDNFNYGNYWSDEKKNEQSEKIKEAYKDGFSEEHIVKLKEKRKGRKPSAKVTKENVLWMRENYNPKKEGFTLKSFANKFNVTTDCVRNIINKKSWKEV
jgi:hypothetical protein